TLPPSDSVFGVSYHDVLIFAGVVLVALVVPFLYSRMTTENFLTPKEFVARISLAFIGSVFCLRFLLEDRLRLSRSSVDLPLALFFGFSVMSLAWNYNVPSAIRDLRGTFLILLLVPLIMNSIRKQWQFDTLLWAMLFTGLATGTLGIMEAYNLYFRWDPSHGWVFARDEIFNGQIDYQATYLPLFPQLASPNYAMESIVSTFGNRNYLGTFTMFTAFVPLAFYFYYERTWMKVASLGLFGYTIMGLYVTRCRAALLGLIVGFAFMTLLLLIFDRQWRFVKRNKNFFLAVALIGASLFLFAVTSVRTSSFMQKIQNTFTMDRSVSNTYERVWVWYATYMSFAQNPVKWLIGSGFGSYKHFFPLQEAETFDDDNKETFTPVTFRQAHNDWLQLVSELGLIGMALFLFLCWRFFGAIYSILKREISDVPDGSFSGRHVVLIALGAAMVAQMMAAVPDFPFHRIETALYAVLMLAMVPLLAESNFFTRPLPETLVKMPYETRVGFVVLALATGMLAIHFEMRCWQADELVRKSEALLQARQTPQMVEQAKRDLMKAISIDPLPGDPYLKMASILELEGKGQEAVEWANRAWKNINFNAR
ncbi:MAG TPA: O-antigen ligase family protein, partial [Candidatus Ozemobacteraceae bacterium]|nr:O-antigen ligase family protein [Candidatus Ozemobacteraceae bacterium]